MKCTALIVCCLVTFICMPVSAADKKDRGQGKSADKHETGSKEWSRRTEGHRPQDLNGDGVITRNEWPGNDESFKELDADGDGALTNKDKAPGAQGSRTRMYDRTVNDYSGDKTPSGKKK